MLNEKMLDKLYELMPHATISSYRGAYRLNITKRMGIEYVPSTGCTKVLIEGCTYAIPKSHRDQFRSWCTLMEMAMKSSYSSHLEQELDEMLEAVNA